MNQMIILYVYVKKVKDMTFKVNVTHSSLLFKYMIVYIFLHPLQF